ncbi:MULTISPECIES: NAD(P)H-binding protein [Lactobacillaceae]|uniref:NAD(P)H-binding protein n=1 Tax=Lactobacillaceae TaxID=33958 RepID=UPI001457631B|nr:NAD(P)H-binding protein [Lactobacillus sp. HBUAS51381]NLR10305.1 NAD(P)H-binding protein [Lactobacillus sp. HBUAS51381]
MKYAISAATGHFGQIVIQQLLKSVPASDIIAIVRNAKKGHLTLPDSITIRQADYTDEAALETALTGIDRLLFISSVPGGAVPRQQQHANMVKAAQAAGVGYVAYTSFAKADTAQSPLSVDHVATEKMITASGLAHSFLRNAWYLENETSYLQAGAEGKSSVYAAGAGQISFALEREYAEAAAKVLLMAEPQTVYEFGGQPRTYADLAAAVDQAIGRPVTFQSVSVADYRQALLTSGMAPEMVDVFASMQQMMKDNELKVPATDLETVLGRSLTPLPTAINEILQR